MPEKPGFKVSLELLEDYTFKIDFDEFGYIISDEPPPLGTGEGPNPARLLASAVANCLSASLIFALSKKKQRPKNLKAFAEGSIDRIDGFWRISGITVKIEIDTTDIEQEVLNAAIDVFEDFCIVTQSVREGIPISLSVNDFKGNTLKP